MVKRIAFAAALALVAASPARAQTPAGESAEPGVDTIVARALVERAGELARAGDHANARMLGIEALERDPRGPHYGAALELVQRANARLGRAARDGVPALPPAGAERPLDPDGGEGDATERPLDPYGDATQPPAERPLDPYGDGGDAAGGELSVMDPFPGGEPGAAAPPRDRPEPAPGDPDRRRARLELTAWGAGYGLTVGIALGGEDDLAAPLGLLGAGAGAGAAWLLTRDEPLTLGQAGAVESFGTWAATDFAFIGHIASGDDEVNGYDLWALAAVGGALGAGGGLAYALALDPDPGDIAFASSLASYGLASSLLLGVAIDPPKDEAYSVNGLVGTTGGFALGLWLADRVSFSRERTLWMDLGAAAGAAAPWVLFYPLVSDDSGEGDERGTAVLSMVTLGAGAYLAWRFTRGMDGGGAGDAAPAGPAALFRRAEDGSWHAGAAVPRPMEDPALATPTGAFSLGLDLIGGRF